MGQPDCLIPDELNAATVRTFIDFDGEGKKPSAQAIAQSEAVAGLWMLMKDKSFAYLGDEVGTGKTRQSLGVIATQFLSKADSQVVIVCSDAEMQRQWESEWWQFLDSCYLINDGRLVATSGKPLPILARHNNLREFAASLAQKRVRIHILRYSSFSWPLTLDNGSPGAMLADYAKAAVTDMSALHAQERAVLCKADVAAEGWAEKMQEALRARFCKRLRAMLAPAGTKADLVIFDEAQYLRHTDNTRSLYIGRIFRRITAKWLFLSATPLHSGVDDLKSLDYYLCRKPFPRGGFPFPNECGSCGDSRQCSKVSAQFEDHGGTPDPNVLLAPFMIRRMRTYADAIGGDHHKLSYRKYALARHSGTDDPFLAMTMALVQKRVVAALKGKPGAAKNGSFISFESLSTSISRALAKRTKDDKPQPDLEPVQDGKREGEGGVALDRNAIDDLNRSFGAAVGTKHCLPHAKLNGAVDDLYERSFANGSVVKTLVFVRRIDSVQEIRDLLHVKFQADLDARIEEWRELLASLPRRNKVWRKQGFWTDIPRIEDPQPDQPGEEENPAPEPEPITRSSRYRDPANLPYFQAQGHKGKLGAFVERLRRNTKISQRPLRGFLLKQPVEFTGSAAGLDAPYWAGNSRHWLRFLKIVLGAERLGEIRNADGKWLVADTDGQSQEAYKLASLQRCLLETICHSDFAVDLYILNTYCKGIPGKDVDLPERLLWLLASGGGRRQGRIFAAVKRFKESCRRWIEHFELIVNKSVRNAASDDWKTVFEERLRNAFRDMAPVIGRSGQLENSHAVPQFKFPCYPNVLVCTDVLKQGVDLHLFCDRVVHYGVAWTSGDLEQRIGRVDRLGSLVCRRISEHAGGELPRIDVKFPYLDGTLDKHQVIGVLRRKLVSDLTMDMGKPPDEAGNIVIESLDQELQQMPHIDVPQERTVFFPATVAQVRTGAASMLAVQVLRRKR